jgi:predicted kinase
MQARPAVGTIPDRATAYLLLAERYTQPRKAAIVITHGVSGSGKTTATQQLLEQLGAVRLRSDIERGRRGETTWAGGDSAADRYSLAARDAVYETLLRKAEIALAAGYPLIADATFLRRKHRDDFRDLARRLAVPFVILAFDADPATLRRRIAQRQLARNDASQATPVVLEQQLAEREPLADDERRDVFEIHGGDLRAAIVRLQRESISF